mmetsp:Transcript_5808/g.14849  ORF Transcript_5808/g.14849 Transcript_5808/m.14849 type:complete len:372 (+) Transcript_5808:266-1381(+)
MARFPSDRGSELDAPSPCCIGAQAFSGNPLAKPHLLPCRDDIAGPQAQFLLVHGRAFAVLHMGDVKAPEMCWMTQAEISRAGELRVTPEGKVDSTRDDRQLIPLFLGQTLDGKLCYAVSMYMGGSDAAREELDAHLRGMGLRMLPMRTALGQLSMQNIAVAGNAIALAGWHHANMFCGKCGSPTRASALGARRICVAEASHRFYPRTDPAVIMLVEDQSGTRALLGRRPHSSEGAFTALSGFIDVGESIEEAVRREVWEEAGVEVGAVSVLGSQPWPIGRAGSNELMIGCFAKALSDNITVNTDEMMEVKWYSREELRAALANSLLEENPFAGGEGSNEAQRLYLPPPFAIAHHLVRAWVNKAYLDCDARL